MGYLSIDEFTAAMSGAAPPGYAILAPYIRPTVMSTPEMYAEVPLRKRAISTAFVMAERYAESGTPKFFFESNPEMQPFSGRKF